MKAKYNQRIAALIGGILLSNAAFIPAAAFGSVENLKSREDLSALMLDTEKEDLRPLSSGYRDDDSGTAPYDSYTTNEEDMKILRMVRTKTSELLADGTATADQIDRQYSELLDSFNDVRFIYHYVGVTGTNGAKIFDDNGNLIQAHGAGIQPVSIDTIAEGDRRIDADGDGRIFIWVGEDKTDKLTARGVHIYYSDDLVNWIDKGLGFETYDNSSALETLYSGVDSTYAKYYTVENLKTDVDYKNIYGEDFKTFADDESNYSIDSAEEALKTLLWDLSESDGCVFERPKLIYNAKTKRWVIWFHSDGPQINNPDGATYSKAKAGVAISETSDPAGPYKYLGSFRLSPGTNSGNPGMARDMNLFVDDKDANNDGVLDAYIIYASNENKDLTISLLDSTYTKLVKPASGQRLGSDISAGDTYNIIASNSKESPAPIKWNGHYYIVYSGTTGWTPNENKYAVSSGDNIMGPYQEVGNPFINGNETNQNRNNAFTTQSSSIIPYNANKGQFIYYGDRWFNPDTGNDISQSRYIMTPLTFVDGDMRILPAADWQVSDMDENSSVEIVDTFPSEATSMSTLMSDLPSELHILKSGEMHETKTKVQWDPYFGPDQPFGPALVHGTLPALNNVEVNFSVTIYPENAVLFMDAGSNESKESQYYERLKARAPELINKQRSDQKYSKGSWGLISQVGSDVDVYKTSDRDIYSTGYWAKSGKVIEYQATLKSGTYEIQAGFKEWWSNKRNTKVEVLNEGDVIAGTSLVPSSSGSRSNSLSFKLDKLSNVSIKISQISGGDPVLSWIGVNKIKANQIVSVNSPSSTIGFHEGDEAKLPDEVTTVQSDGQEVVHKVTWLEENFEDLHNYDVADVKGIVSGTSLPAMVRVQKIPRNVEYFIDVNNLKSKTFEAVKTISKQTLINQVPDKEFLASDGWGNTSSSFKQRDSLVLDDPYETGIYADDGSAVKTGQLEYKVTLRPGRHSVELGFMDWWWVTRPTRATVTFEGGDKKDLGEIDVTHDHTRLNVEIFVPGAKESVVTIQLESSEGSGPVLSWVSITGDPITPIEVKPVEVEVQKGEIPQLPSIVTVTYSDASNRSFPVVWENIDWNSETSSSTNVVGQIEGLPELSATATVTWIPRGMGQPGTGGTASPAESQQDESKVDNDGVVVMKEGQFLDSPKELAKTGSSIAFGIATIGFLVIVGILMMAKRRS